MKKALLFVAFVCISIHAPAQKLIGETNEIKQILSQIEAFSKAIVNADFKSVSLAYTEDAKIFPNNRTILSGRKAIYNYWLPKNESRTIYHKLFPEEIKIVGNEAYDYGYYEGKTKNKDGSKVSWKGKYVVVWKKVGDNWLIYLDIWNRVPLKSRAPKK